MTRPYFNHTGKELDDELGRQLGRQVPRGRRTVDWDADTVEVTAFGDTQRSFLVHESANLNNSFSTGANTTNTVYWSPTVTSNGMFETTYVVAADGKARVKETKARPVEGSAKAESDMDWLERRVDEVCWVPA